MADHDLLRPARTLIMLRILTLYPVALGWPTTTPDGVEVVLVVLLVVSTSLLALRWRAVLPPLRRHPGFAVVDVAVSLLVLAYAGPTSPFVAYTLTSAVLVGLLFARFGALLLCALLVSGYLLLVGLADPTALGHISVLGVPVAYALLASAGSAFRGMHDQLSRALAAEVAAERSASTAHERNRLARDLHDGVSSTLQGLVLQSMAVARTADTSGQPTVADLSRQLESAARSALAQSREVLVGLRQQDDSAPLVQAVADRARRWSERSGIPTAFTNAGVADVHAANRIAALRVLDEALENVRRHAQATRVEVSLTGDSRVVRLDVRDDGRGVPALTPGVSQGHYGLLGMSERATVVGGRLTIEPGCSSGAGESSGRPGTRVCLELPRSAAGAHPLGAPA